MLFKCLYTLDDFQRLTQEEILKIIKIMNLEIPGEDDEYEYLYKNMDMIDKYPSVERVVTSKVLAGQVSIKWYRFTYNNDFTKKMLEENLLSTENGYNAQANQRMDVHEDIVSIFLDEENIYTLKICIPNGKKRIYDENGYGYKKVNTKKNIIAKIDIQNQWLEIRGDYSKCEKVKKILEKKLHIYNLYEVDIMKKYGGDISCFKDSLINGFYLNYKAVPDDEIELTEDDCKAIVRIMDSINMYFIDKNGKQLIETLKDIDWDTDGLSIYSIFLAGIDHLGIQIKKDSENDLSKQSIYSIFKDYMVEDSGYISFSTEKNGENYTIQIGKKTNSIAFRTSATEEVIAYIRGLLI